ncbi:MAG: hypothetical protein LBV77_06655 [Candidatus Adiutrix intracellularis]|nr:hypothetical protein [Candidatus Adiutrix intracellularis]
MAIATNWRQITLPAELNIADVDENELYAAIDWLIDKQGAINVRLAE